jgi:glycosyltransferase involved in cell wall biosynthesis
VTAHDRQPTKVVRIIARLNIGGPARHVLLLDDALTRAGYDTLLVHGSVGPEEGSFEGLAERSGLRTRKIAPLGRDVRVLGDLSAFVQLLQVIFRESPDIIHTHTAKAGTLGRIAAALYNITRRRDRRCVIVHTFHGHVLTGYFSEPASRIVRFAERLLARITDCVIAISPSQQRDLVERFNVAAASQTAIIPLGLDLGPLLTERPTSEAKRSLGLEEQHFVIGYVGRFVPIKNLEGLVRAFAVVSRHIPHGVLLLAGDGPTRPQLEALGVQLGIAERIKFVGWNQDLARLYGAIDVCCLTSLNEGTPVALIEAMAARKAVVATSVGGVVDLVEDGRTGILVPPKNVDALAAAIVRLARDPALCQRLGAAARAAVVDTFSIERLSCDIDRTYQELLRRKRVDNAGQPAAPASV